MKYTKSTLLIFAIFCLFGSAMAQTSTGVVVGRVVDQNQAVLQNADVVLKNVNTGAERRTKTDVHGNYLLVAVQPGRYTITATSAGFAPATMTLDVTIAASTQVNLTLGVQGVTENLVVGRNGIAVQTRDAQLGLTINERLITSLPTLNPSLYTLAYGAPGTSSGSSLRGIDVSANGQRLSSGNFILDGGENNDVFVATPGLDVPRDAVQEIRVQTNHFQSEYGRNSGFIVNVVTKSGSNSFHGSAYWFNVNSGFAANSFNNNANGLKRPVSNANQLSLAAGGPIQKDKLFFFGSFMPDIRRTSSQATFFVPTPELLAVSSPASQALLQKYPVVAKNLSATNVTIRTVCPYGKTCTGGANQVTIPAFAFGSQLGGNSNDIYRATGRIDYNLSERTQMFGRYALDHATIRQHRLQPYGDDFDARIQERNQNLLLDLTRVLSNSLVSESRVVYSRVFPLIPQVPKEWVSSFSILGETVRLPTGIRETGGPQNINQFFQTISWNPGKHNMKFGGQYIQIRDNRTLQSIEAAVARFNNVQGFVDGIIGTFSVSLDPKGRVPGEKVDPPYGPPSFTRHFRYNEIGVFAQDAWRMTPRLTLTSGLRWEYFGQPHSPEHEKLLDANFYFGEGANIFERIANARFLRTADAPGKYKGKFYLPDYNNFAPRLGLAYDVFGNGKTVFRSGVGVYYDRIYNNVLFNMIQNPPNYSTTLLTNVPLTPALLTNLYSVFPATSLTLSGSTARQVDQDLRTAYTVSWNATLEREVLNKMVVGASYVGASGSRLLVTNDLNRVGSGQFLGRPNTRLNPNVSLTNTRTNQGHSSYHGLVLSVNTRYLEKPGLQLFFNFSWNHSIDNASSILNDDSTANSTGFGLLDPFSPQRDRGSSDFDVRHKLDFAFVWNVPFGKNSSSWFGRNVIGGWGISGTFLAQSGQPYNITDTGVPDFIQEMTRPRLTGPIPEKVFIPDARTPNRFLYLPINRVYDAQGRCNVNATPFSCQPSVNGPYGGIAPRNFFRRPGTWNAEAAFFKEFRLSRNNEALKLQLRSEMFNVFNHANLFITPGNVRRDQFNESLTSQPVPGVTASYSGNRTVTMALRLTF